MKLTILQENLKNKINLTSHFISQKAQMPILGNILLKASKTNLILSATNLETSISTSIPAKIIEEGEITVNGKILNDIINNLPVANLEIETEKESIKIISGSYKTKILGMNSSDFPLLPENITNEFMKIDRNEFVNSLSKILFSVSNDETRPILTGVLFIIKDNILSLVSTDGFRLSEIELKNKINIPDTKILVPKAVLHEISKIESSEIIISYEKDNNQILFKLDGSLLSSRTIEGDFPDYQKIIPKSSLLTINIDKMDFEKSIKLASVFARDSGNIIKFKIEGEFMKISAESSSNGKQEIEINIRKEETYDKEVEIMFNYRFIEDFLKTVEGDEIQIQISPDNKASKFIDPKSPNFLHIIMPIKTNN